MSELPGAYTAHLDAATAPDTDALRRIWEPDGVLEFPYASSLGTPTRLDGIDAVTGYFGELALFGPFTISDEHAWPTGASEWLVELHGSSTLLATGAAYEQDYIARFRLSGRGRIAWMREYWDPTRALV